jgi:hypothetical protein
MAGRSRHFTIRFIAYFYAPQGILFSSGGVLSTSSFRCRYRAVRKKKQVSGILIKSNAAPEEKNRRVFLEATETCSYPCVDLTADL